MSPADANTAIRKQLAQFYAKYKSDNNYGKPLNPAVQAQLLAKVDEMLPPAPVAEPVTSSRQYIGRFGNSRQTTNTGITPEALQLSQLERQTKEAEEKQLWMMILGAIAGLIVGAGAVYLLAYRSLKNEVDRLNTENKTLSRQFDSLRNKTVVATNEPRQPQDRAISGKKRMPTMRFGRARNRQCPDGYPAVETANGPLDTTDRQVVRSGEPVIEPNQQIEPSPVQTQPMPVQTPANRLKHHWRPAQRCFISRPPIQQASSTASRKARHFRPNRRTGSASTLRIRRLLRFDLRPNPAGSRVS